MRGSSTQFDELAKCKGLVQSANGQLSQKDVELDMLISLNSKEKKVTLQLPGLNRL